MTTEEQVQAADDEKSDPFAALDHALGVDRVRDAYAKFAELRKRGGLLKGGLWTLFGLDDPASVVYQDSEFYSAISYNAVNQILRDGKTFSSSGYAKVMGPVMGHSILEMDEPEHTSYRTLLEQVFNRKALQRWEGQVVAPTVNGLIDKFVDRGSANLVKELTFPFPVQVITGLLGLPAEDHHQFHRWAIELINVAGDPARGIAASQKLHDYFIVIINQRREEAKDDLISVLAHAELEGRKLDDEEICAFLRLLLPAGAETTSRSSANLIFGLLSNPDQLNAVRDDRSLIPQAIDEGVRWESPLTGIMRTVAVDTEVEGVKMAAGSSINVCTGSANHDETRWENPEDFDIFRKRIPNLAFGFGVHVCLGQHLARLETTVALNAIFDRLPNLRLDPAAEDIHIPGLVFRSPTALPVLFG